MPTPRDTSDRLRHEIETGQTGDKIDYPDPAAAPLGTDDEASGHPITQGQAASARRHEVGRLPPPEPAAGIGLYLLIALLPVLLAGIVWIALR
jgi:hypothetical protein